MLGARSEPSMPRSRPETLKDVSDVDDSIVHALTVSQTLNGAPRRGSLQKHRGFDAHLHVQPLLH